MSKNLYKKGLALGAVLALGVTGITGIAASAAVGDVTLAPKTGTGTSVFSTDAFTLESKVKTTVVTATTLAYRIDNPDQNHLLITLGGSNTASTAIGINSAGATVSVGSVSAAEFSVDFAAKDIDTLVIYGITAAGAQNDISVEILEDVLVADNTNLAGSVTNDRPDYGDLTASTSVDVTAWVETTVSPSASSYKTVEGDFVSAKQTITFVDPSSVNVISKIERLAGATANNKLTAATAVVRVSGSGDAESISILDAGTVFSGVTLVSGDTVLLTDTGSGGAAVAHGLYTVGADGTAPSLTTATASLTGQILVLEGSNRGLVYNASHTVLRTDATSSTNVLNAGNDNVLGASVDFSNQNINLAQVDLTKWEVAVDSSSTDDLPYGSAGILQVATPAGYASTDSLGRLFVQAPVADLNLNDGATYSLKFRHLGDTVAPIVDFVSPGYQVVEAPTSTATQISAAPTSSTDAVVGTHSSGYPVSIRNGAAAVTFKSQIKTGGVAVETANVPVLAIVTAGANLPSGATVQVSGATETIKAASGSMIVTGLTDSKGNWSVTVTSSDTSSAGSAYAIQFYVLDEDATDVWVTTDGANDAIYNADYSGAALATTDGFTADSTVLSGDTATVTFTVKDQFGQPLSANSTGKAYSVELKAPDKTKLEQFVAVVGGKATFTIKNYLATGESQILTAKLFTGTSTTPSYVTGAVNYVTLYNTNAVAGVNVVAEVTGVVVTYDDFITGASSSTNVAPTDDTLNGTGEDFLYTGTVVDSNGAGVPGAPVTISGKGLQFVKTGTTTYYVDSITVAATDAGTFSVSAWTHVASATGNVVTATSGTKSGTTKVKSALPVDANGTDGSTGLLSAANLQLSWNAPKLPVSNTTYAVTATVSDKWGNPVKGANVTFSGYAAALFNGAATATKTTGAAGTAVAYLRSLKNVDGVSAIAVTLNDIDQDADGKSDSDNLAAVLTDAVATKWNEAAWSNELTSDFSFFAVKPTASITKPSKGASATVKGATGGTIKIVRGTKSKTKVATKNSQKITLKNGKGKVKVYVNGVRIARK